MNDLAPTDDVTRIPRMRMILETDIFSDVDDVGALAIAHVLADRGHIDLAAVSVNTPSVWGPRAAAVVNAFFGRDDVPIGANLPGTEDEAEVDFARHISERFAAGKSPRVAPSETVLRRALAESPDGGVVMTSIGFFGNLVRLLDSGPDDMCSLSGRDLIRAKVCRTVVMGGTFPAGREFNIASFPHDAARFVSEWPCEIEFVGWEVGHDVITGRATGDSPVDRDPVAAAYQLYTSGRGRPSWDLIAVHVAAMRTRGLYWYSEPGRVHVGEDGANTFHAEPDGPHRYVKRVANAVTIAGVLDEMLHAGPGHVTIEEVHA